MSVNPYGVANIHETCLCGAKFEWSGDTWLGKCAAERFRKDHARCRELATTPQMRIAGGSFTERKPE